MLENKTAADFRRTLKKIHGLCLRHSSGVTLLLTQLSLSPWHRQSTQLLQVHLQGVGSKTPKIKLFVRKKLPLIKICLRISLYGLGPVPIFLEKVAFREVGLCWYQLGLPWKCNRSSPSGAGLKI